MARSRLPLTVSEMTSSRDCTCEAERPLGALGLRLGAFHGIAWIGLEEIETDEELEEGRDAGEAGADGNERRFTAREADAVGKRRRHPAARPYRETSGGWPKKWRRVR